MRVIYFYKQLILGAALLLSSITLQADTANSVKPLPDVEFERVDKIFGNNIYSNDPTLKLFLLAIAMDHTSTASTFTRYKIGIPYIAETGAGYWVKRLKNKDYALDVVVNNALILLFSKEDIPNRKAGTLTLMQIAETHAYWPASFYLAESQLAEKLSLDYSAPIPYRLQISDPTRKNIASDVMKRFNFCAEVGFSPCQFRIGFWLVGAQGNLENGLNIIRSAINTTLADPRYNDVLDSYVALGTSLVLENIGRLKLDANEASFYSRALKRVSSKTIADRKE
jgi:hypothetical protein